MAETKKQRTKRFLTKAITDPRNSIFNQMMGRNKIASNFDKSVFSDVGQMIDAYDEMLKTDGHIKALARNRTHKVLEKDFKIISPKKPSKKEIKYTEFIESVIYDDIYDFIQVLENIYDATFKGFSIQEILFKTKTFSNKTYITVDKILSRDPRDFRKGFDGEVYYDADRSFQSNTITLIPDIKIISYVYRGLYGNYYGISELGKAVWWLYIFKKEARKSWVRWLEDFGRPTPYAKVPDTIGDDDREDLEDMLDNLAESIIAVMPEEIDLQFYQPATSGTDLFQLFIQAIDTEISKAILGETLTVDSGNYGSYSLANVHQEEGNYVVNYDCKKLENVINKQLIKRICDLNFNIKDSRYPKMQFNLEDRDLARTSDALLKLYSIGFPLSIQGIGSMLNIPVGDKNDEDDLLVKPIEQEGSQENKKEKDITDIKEPEADSGFDNMVK